MTCREPKTGALIARYEMGLLSDEERRRFETHLLECDACFQDYYQFAPVAEVISRERAALRTALAREGRSWFASLWEQVRELISLPASSPGLSPALTWGLAVVVALVVLFVLLPVPEAYEELAMIEPFPYQHFELRLRGPQQRSTWRRTFDAGMRAYSDGDYLLAMQKLEEAHELNPDDVETRFFLGVSALLSDRPETGIPHLQAVVEEPTLPPGAVRWYLARALFLEGAYGRAEEQLEELAQMDGPHAERAQDLRERLRRAESDWALLRYLQRLKYAMTRQ